jgi:hypothetical protein
MFAITLWCNYLNHFMTVLLIDFFQYKKQIIGKLATFFDQRSHAGTFKNIQSSLMEKKVSTSTLFPATN